MIEVTIMPKKYTSVNWSDVPSVLSTHEAAAVLGIHINTIKRLIYAEKIPAFKIGRNTKIHKADLMKYAGLDPTRE